MPLPRLEPEALQLFVFGPGTGELVIVRAPPDNWLVVDGCGLGGTMYAPRVLAHYGAKPDIVLFTHPHSDHYRGLQEVIDDATADPEGRWPLLGMVAPASLSTATGPIMDHVRYLAEGGAEQVISAISDRWERRPACRWTLQPGDVRALGAASVRVVSPTVPMRGAAQKAYEEDRHFDANTLSAAVELSWEGHRLVLGSDLVESPGGGWSGALKVQPNLPSHRAFKIPHHGSLKALHGPVLARTEGHEHPSWMVTPFASRNLPGCAPGQGLDALLVHVPSVDLTALPRPHAHQSQTAEEFPISGLRPSSRHLTFTPTTPGFPDCYVITELRRDGSHQLYRGPGSVRVTRAT